MASTMLVRGGGLTKARHTLLALQLIARPRPPRMETYDMDGATAGHCILLHGWGSQGAEGAEIAAAARRLPTARGWGFINVTYDTQWTTFAQSARAIAQALSFARHQASRTILVGYSMGGIVARQLVALGLPCDALVTICTPHHGPAPWIPTPHRGPRSISRHSRALAALNRNAIDRAHRDRYHFFAITYTDRLGQHDHDGFVERRSAWGDTLGKVAARELMPLAYPSPALFDAHWRGRFARYIRPVITRLGELMDASA